MSEEPAPYTTNGVLHGRQHAQDEELTMAHSALKRLHTALKTMRSTEAMSQQKVQAFLDGQQASGILQALLEDWYDELVALQEGE
jgi:hypothetical protein